MFFLITVSLHIIIHLEEVKLEPLSFIIVEQKPKNKTQRLMNAFLYRFCQDFLQREGYRKTPGLVNDSEYILQSTMLNKRSHNIRMEVGESS